MKLQVKKQVEETLEIETPLYVRQGSQLHCIFSEQLVYTVMQLEDYSFARKSVLKDCHMDTSYLTDESKRMDAKEFWLIYREAMQTLNAPLFEIPQSEEINPEAVNQ